MHVKNTRLRMTRANARWGYIGFDVNNKRSRGYDVLLGYFPDTCTSRNEFRFMPDSHVAAKHLLRQLHVILILTFEGKNYLD